MLWPLADRPRLSPGVPGGTIPVRLVDDDLATSLATGGRLDTLLSAAEFATSHDVDPDGAVNRALCLAVDPDLLVTVNAMTGGYVVSNSPDGPAQQPGTPTHPGHRSGRRHRWLDRLRALAHRTCVAPLPYAQADLDALQRVNDPGLGATATNSAGDIVDQILDVHLHPRGHAAAGRPADQQRGRPAQRQRQHGRDRRRRLVRPGLQGADAPAAVDTAPRRLSPQVVVAPFDPAVGRRAGRSG